MKQAIAVLAHHSNAPFLRDLMESLKGCEYPIVVLGVDSGNSPREFTSYLESLRRDGVEVVFSTEDGYDSQILRYMYENTEYDEWLLLHDTFVLKSLEFLDICFMDLRGHPVCLFRDFWAFVGKYTRDTLHGILPPACTDKIDDIALESLWAPEYANYSRARMIEPPSGNSEILIEERHDTVVMVCENEWFAKLKRSWQHQHPEQPGYRPGLPTERPELFRWRHDTRASWDALEVRRANV